MDALFVGEEREGRRSWKGTALTETGEAMEEQSAVGWMDMAALVL